MNIQKFWPGWEVQETIGKGSFGTVYKIVRTGSAHSLSAALKVISVPSSPSIVEDYRSQGMDDNSIKSFLENEIRSLENEIQVMISLKSSTNIVSIEDYYIEPLTSSIGWEFYIRMELLQSLSSYLKTRGPLSVREVAEMGIHLCDALQACEEKNIIHRDIKPANIFRNPSGTYKLGDFGIAKQLDNASMAMTRAGTISYEAPEVYLGQRYDQTVDLYSLGIVLYCYLNNGRRPFLPPYPQPITASDTETALSMRMRNVPLPDPAGGHPVLNAIIKKACAFHPKDRYQNARQMKQELQNFLYGSGSADSGAGSGKPDVWVPSEDDSWNTSYENVSGASSSQNSFNRQTSGNTAFRQNSYNSSYAQNGYSYQQNSFNGNSQHSGSGFQQDSFNGNSQHSGSGFQQNSFNGNSQFSGSGYQQNSYDGNSQHNGSGYQQNGFNSDFAKNPSGYQQNSFNNSSYSQNPSGFQQNSFGSNINQNASGSQTGSPSSAGASGSSSGKGKTAAAIIIIALIAILGAAGYRYLKPGNSSGSSSNNGSSGGNTGSSNDNTDNTAGSADTADSSSENADSSSSGESTPAESQARVETVDKDKNGIPESEIEYNDYGDKIRSTYYYSDGKLSSETIFEYDEAHALIKSTSYNRWKEMRSYTLFENDSSGNPLSYVTYDRNDQEWYTGEYEYAPEGWKKKSLQYYHDTGKLYSLSEYDESGNTIHYEHYNHSGNLESSSDYERYADGTNKVTLQYDKDGKLSYKSEYSEDGIEERWFIYDEETGFVDTQYVNDGHGRTAKIMHYKDGLSGGILESYTTVEYDDANHTEKRTEYNALDELQGYRIYETNKYGDTVSSTSYNADGTVSYSYSYEYEYDAFGNKTKSIYKGYSTDTTIYEYDEYHNCVKETNYSEDGELESYTIHTYDSHGDMVSYVSYDKDGNETYRYDY